LTKLNQNCLVIYLPFQNFKNKQFQNLKMLHSLHQDDLQIHNSAFVNTTKNKCHNIDTCILFY